MFHTYILPFHGAPIDFDRAKLIMDREILRQSIKAMNKETRRDAKIGPQWIWDHYCQRHLERYGNPFRPDIDPTWDR